MSIINSVIQPQAFEVVRDRIGRILTDELDNQFQISYNDDLRVKSWVERFVPFDASELPSVNVTLAEGSYGGQTVIQSDGTYKYFVDAYVHAKSTSKLGGDARATQKLHRLLGVCRSIIEDARYVRLGFRPGFVMNRHIESLQIQNPSNKEHDAESSIMGRLTVVVKVPEVTTYKQPVNIAGLYTTVKLASTDKGYQWIDRYNTLKYFDEGFDDYFE